MYQVTIYLLHLSHSKSSSLLRKQNFCAPKPGQSGWPKERLPRQGGQTAHSSEPSPTRADPRLQQAPSYRLPSASPSACPELDLLLTAGGAFVSQPAAGRAPALNIARLPSMLNIATQRSSRRSCCASIASFKGGESRQEAMRVGLIRTRKKDNFTHKVCAKLVKHRQLLLIPPSNQNEHWRSSRG